MAENTPATEAATPTAVHRSRRKPLPRKETTPAPPTAKKSKTDIAIDAAAARLAAAAPPLSEVHKRRLAELFAPAASTVVKR